MSYLPLAVHELYEACLALFLYPPIDRPHRFLTARNASILGNDD